MTTRTSKVTAAAALALSFGLVGCNNGSNDNAITVPAGPTCEVAAPQALQACISTVNSAERTCYLDGDSACNDRNADILAAKDTLQSALQSSCADGEFMGLTVEATVGRLQAACQSQPDGIAWRTFGGPQGAVLPTATEEQRDCLQSAHQTVSQFFDDALVAINACLAEDDCDTAALTSTQQEAAAAAATTIAQACPALENIIAVKPAEYVALAEDQLDCTVATAHADTSGLELGCGPSNVDVVPPRGEWTQIVLDGDKWGTMCGDGTDYAVHVRLAPEGYPLDRVLIALQGGGVCLFEADCKSRMESSPNLLNAQGDDDLPLGAGIASNSPDNPFANWTKIYLPYCNQDVFMGGGVVEKLSDDLSLPRYGAVNMRAGVRVLRDILWKEMDAAGGTGFRPDELVALFGGFSAGGYGVIYNYHWILDNLQWPRTAAFPDAGGALDNGELAGVRALGPLKIPAWGARPHLPPYCFEGDCAVGTTIYQKMSPRLKQVPEQQMLILSNQRDDTQQRDAFFSDRAKWIDTIRAAYCDTKDLPGIQWYLTGESESVHVISIRDYLFYGDVAGKRMVDWLWGAVIDPDNVTDWAEEGTFTTDIPGSHPFPCALPNQS